MGDPVPEVARPDPLDEQLRGGMRKEDRLDWRLELTAYVTARRTAYPSVNPPTTKVLIPRATTAALPVSSIASWQGTGFYSCGWRPCPVGGPTMSTSSDHPRSEEVTEEESSGTLCPHAR